jgi:hypothetical protein
MNILKQDNHLLFRGQEIWEGIRNEDIEASYERFMLPSNNISKMSLFFVVVHIRVVEDMVCKDITLFQEIWEQTNEKQGEDSFLNIRRYLQCREDKDMGWINMRWGVCFKFEVLQLISPMKLHLLWTRW